MKIRVITLFPDLIESYLKEALLAKARENSLLEIQCINLRNFSDNNYKSVDDTPFGGGDGMIMRADILEKALISIKTENSQVILMSPQGQVFSSQMARELSQSPQELIFICGRYGGVDQRFIDAYVDTEISIGDYVLSGGELAALTVIEAASRFVPGVLGKIESAENDSFTDSMLEAPQYTRPQVWKDLKVPDVLLSGHHEKIKQWREQESKKVTALKRPDLLKKEKA